MVRRDTCGHRVRVPSSASTPPRIALLDVARGFALCGIIFVNAPTVLARFHDQDLYWRLADIPAEAVLQVFVQQRFFPIFSLLFGIGFGMIWGSARRRTDRPRLALLRRIGMLAALGALHQIIQPGEALLPYAIAALFFLLPATFLPARLRWVPIVAGAALTVAGALSGGMALIPGLFLLGFGLAGYRVPERLTGARAGVVAAALALIIAGISAPAVIMLISDPTQIALWPFASVLGLVMATGYLAALVALLATPLSGALRAIFAPLGRMALTNYIGASLVLMLVALTLTEPLGIDDSQAGRVRLIIVCAGILLAQLIISTLWLRAFGQGPLERAWRRFTWWEARPRTAGRQPSSS